MAKKLYYIAVFQTHFVENDSVSITDAPVRIRVFRGSKTYQVPVQLAQRFSAKEEKTWATSQTLELTEGHYLEISVETKIMDFEKAKRFCEEEIDKTVSILASVFNIHLFDLLEYKGWIIRKNWGAMGGWVQTVDAPKFQINPKELKSDFLQIERHLRKDKDRYKRFKLMSRFFSKALSDEIGEEKFLLLWTILEIFPMKETSNIAPISASLGKILDKDSAYVKEKLGIGKLYGLRCSLVHNGVLSVDELDFDIQKETQVDSRTEYRKSDTIARLEYIVREIMRCMCGLTYSGALDRYLS